MTRLLCTLLLLVALTPTARAQSEQAGSGEAGTGDRTVQDTGDATEDARAHFKLGVDFYRERNFRAALIEFQRAYAASPHYKLLYNLGQASLELQEYAIALEHFTGYLREGGEEITAERRQEVEETIASLQARIASVTIVSNQEGAEIYVDDTLIGRSPLAEAVPVGAGRHKVTAIKEGLEPIERWVDVAAGDAKEVRLDFEDRSATAELGPRETTVIRVGQEANTPAIWAGVATAALGAGAITLTILTTLAEKDYKNELDGETTKAKLDELRDEAEVKALATDIAWGATLVAGVVTAVFIVTADPDADAEDHVKRDVDVGVGPGSVMVSGRF
jgi:tetratricopeptide (TPR) repeat protein